MKKHYIDLMKQINEELAKEMRNEFDKQKERKSTIDIQSLEKLINYQIAW